jgi:hypothetical protein
VPVRKVLCGTQQRKNVSDLWDCAPVTERKTPQGFRVQSPANDGKIDLSRIQIEGVIVKVVKDKFPDKFLPQN